MAKKKNLVHGVYEVLDQSTHKYTSTTVSGGGTNASGGLDAVQSSVSYHSDQEIWVQDVDSGKQRKFDFSSFNVDVRPGHTLMLVWDTASNGLERVINVDTQTRYHCGGAYNTWDIAHHFVRSRLGRVLNAAMVALFSVIPLLGWALTAFLSLFSMLNGRLVVTGTRFTGWRNRVHALVLLLCVGAHAMISIAAMEGVYVADYWMRAAGPESLLASLALVTHYFTLFGEWIYLTIASGYGPMLAHDVYYALVSPEWSFTEVMSFTVAELGATFRMEILQPGIGATRPGYWWSHTAGLATYAFVVTWWANRGNGKAIIKGSDAIDAYVAEVKKDHPAFV